MAVSQHQSGRIRRTSGRFAQLSLSIAAALLAATAGAQQPVTPPVDRADVPAGEDQALLDLAASGEASDELRSDPTFQVVEVVARWARAWQAQDPEGYLEQYAADFAPSSGASRESWASRRRERLRAPRSIRVTVLELDVALQGPDAATATFRQIYESDRFGDVVRKTLRLARRDGEWRIVREDAVALRSEP